MMDIAADKSIRSTVEAGLCCFCGACEGLCPTGAISLNTGGTFPVPVVDPARCNQCGLCSRVCPGMAIDFDSLNQDIFSRRDVDYILGEYREMFVGAATDQTARQGRTSGGLAKEIAIWGLEAGLWQGAAVSKLEAGFPRPVSFIATSKADVESAGSSLYCPVPICSLLGRLKDFPGKVCVVGLPCHLAAIRKAQRELPHLREKIAFTVGLFCSGTPGYDATEAFLRFHGISRQQVASFAYRWRGWPGDIRVETADGRIRNFPRGKAAGLGDRLRFAACFQRRGAFAARRCLLCPDHTAELADVSLGDPWHKAYRSDKLGLTAAIVRSPQAGSILGQMVTAGRIFLEKIDATRLLESQQACLASKKRIGVAIKVFCTAGRAVPVYTHQPDLPCNMWDRLSARFEQVQTSLARRRRLWWLLPMLAVIMAWLRRKSSRSLRQNP